MSENQLSYWFSTDTNTHRGLVAFRFMGCSRQKAPRMEGFCRSPAPLVNQLSHNVLSFLFKKKKKYSPQENTSTAAVTQACLHSNRCAPVRLRRSPGTFAWLVGLEKSTDGADSGFRARRWGSPPRRVRMSCWCRPMAVMQMPNRGGGRGGWRGGRLAWLGLEVPQALSKTTFPLIVLHCSEGLR